MKYGVKRELLPLVKLRNIGRVRARRLFNNGITSPEDIRRAGLERISSILGKGIAEQLFYDTGYSKGTAESAAEEDSTPSEAEQSTLSHFGE